jgi:hypothetical protein
LASKDTNPHSNLARVFFFPVSDLFYILDQLFSDLASENSEFEKLIHTPVYMLVEDELMD